MLFEFYLTEPSPFPFYLVSETNYYLLDISINFEPVQLVYALIQLKVTISESYYSRILLRTLLVDSNQPNDFSSRHKIWRLIIRTVFTIFMGTYLQESYDSELRLRQPTSETSTPVDTAPALDMITLHQLPVAIAQPTGRAYQPLPAFVYLPAAAASLHPAADVHPAAVSSSVESANNNLPPAVGAVGEAQVQRAFSGSGFKSKQA